MSRVVNIWWKKICSPCSIADILPVPRSMCFAKSHCQPRMRFGRIRKYPSRRISRRRPCAQKALRRSRKKYSRLSGAMLLMAWWRLHAVISATQRYEGRVPQFAHATAARNEWHRSPFSAAFQAFMSRNARQYLTLVFLNGVAAQNKNGTQCHHRVPRRPSRRLLLRVHRHIVDHK